MFPWMNVNLHHLSMWIYIETYWYVWGRHVHMLYRDLRPCWRLTHGCRHIYNCHVYEADISTYCSRRQHHAIDIACTEVLALKWFEPRRHAHNLHTRALLHYLSTMYNISCPHVQSSAEGVCMSVMQLSPCKFVPVYYVYVYVHVYL